MKPLAGVLAETRAERLEPGLHKLRLAGELRAMAAAGATWDMWPLSRYAVALAATVTLLGVALTQAEIGGARALATPIVASQQVPDLALPDLRVEWSGDAQGGRTRAIGALPAAEMFRLMEQRWRESGLEGAQDMLAGRRGRPTS